ncbi:MAG: MopE-related protein [Myxococcota bacterium]
MRLLPLSVILASACLAPPPAPTLVGVEPRLIDGNVGAPLVLTGTGLLPTATLDFDRPSASVVSSSAVSAWLTTQGGARVDLADVAWVSATQVTARVPAATPVGTWDLHLVAPRGQALSLPSALEVFDCTDVDCSQLDAGFVDGGAVACAELNYRDRDRDGFGSGPASSTCGAGWVPVAGDCDDGDALMHPQATEVCNGLDDDCDGVTDESACSGGSTWTSDASLRGRGDLLVAASWARGRLWAGGARLFVRRGEGMFPEVGAACPTRIAALWPEPSGEVEVAGTVADVGHVASHTTDGVQCLGDRLVAEPIVAMTGFMLDGGALYVGVSARGQLFRWDRGGLPVPGPVSNLPADAVVTDLHGTSPEQLYAVGSAVQGNRRFAVWRLGADGGWVGEPLGDLGDPKGELSGVWALDSEVLAVGKAGLVLRKSGGVWRRVPSDTNADLTSVRAFSGGRFYVSQADGRVRRRAQGGWREVFRADPAVRLNDLCGTAEDDLWAVGNDGVVGRGPH